jgi:glucose-1-phosphate thymidylyltransferase
VRHEVVDGWWIDTGKLAPLLEGNRLILETITPRVDGTVDGDSRIEGRVVIEEGATLINSTVRGPAIVGRDTVVRDSYIGPYTSVYFGCEIVNTEIEHSVVLEQSRIEGVPRMQDSLIGKQVVVTRSEARPKATRLMLGDHSVVDLE